MNHKIADGWAVTALICASACWGGATVITKSMLTAIPPLTLLVIQLGVSVFLLWLLVAVSSNFPTSCAAPSIPSSHAVLDQNLIRSLLSPFNRALH